MDSPEILNELCYSISPDKAYSFSELLVFAQQGIDIKAFEEAIILDKRFICMHSDSKDEEYFLLDSGLFRWLSTLNIRLAQKNIFKLSLNQVASKLSSLRNSGKWNLPPAEAIKWGSRLGLICFCYEDNQFVFPLAKVLANLKKGLFVIACDVLIELFEQHIWNYPLHKQVDAFISQGFSSYDDKTSYIVKHREALSKGGKKTLQQIGNRYRLSRERVRQIEEKFWISLYFGFQRIKPFIKAFLCNFMKKSGSLIIDVNSSGASKRLFLAKCIRIPQLELPNIGLILLATSQKELLPLKSSRWFPEGLNFGDLAKRFESEGHINLSAKDVEFLSKKTARFRLRKLTKLHRVYLTLRDIGRPAHFSEITNVHNFLFPNHTSVEHNIHAALSFQKLGVIWIGVKGTYALKEWGYERPSMTLCDTISKIVYEKYSEIGRPISISIIKAELGKYRRIVKESSITLATYTNPKLKCVGKDMFVPKSPEEETNEEIELDELDKIFRNFQQKGNS